MGAVRKDCPCFARWGAFAKGAVKMQRWGRIAKVGAKRKEEGGVKTQMSLFNKNKLMEAVRDRGYVTERAVCDALAPIFGISSKSMESRLRHGTLNKEECEVIGSYFEMTMKEYYDVFMSGLFIEDNEGHYVCHVDDLKAHLVKEKNGAGIKLNRKTKAQMREELLEEIENYGK